MNINAVKQCFFQHRRSQPSSCYAQKAIALHFELSSEIIENVRYEMQKYAAERISSSHMRHLNSLRVRLGIFIIKEASNDTII